jgi:cell division protein FtsB
MSNALQLLSRYGVTVFLTVVLVWFQAQLWIGRGSLPDVWRMQSQLNGLTQEINRVTQANVKLKAEVKDLKDGLDMVEERARAELGMIKPNEVLVQYKR